MVFLDQHYVCRSHDPTLDISPTFVKKSKKSSSILFFFHVFFFFGSFFIIFPPIIYRPTPITWMELVALARVISLQFIVESCTSPSNNLISLSYSMPVFSVNLFGLFQLRLYKGNGLILCAFCSVASKYFLETD